MGANESRELSAEVSAKSSKLFLGRAREKPTESILRAIEEVSEKFQLCRNRVWEIVCSVDSLNREQLLRIPLQAGREYAGSHEGHDQCTFDFCELSRLDFTRVSQRHESCDGKCATEVLDPEILSEALDEGRPTAWQLDGKSVVESGRPFMAISHVWSNGTGAGAWPQGQVNGCLFAYFSTIARDLQCDGIWWDTICIPREKAARSKAIVNMERNYENSRLTLVHDCFLRSWEWTTPQAASFAIALSPWFSRGWTAMELVRSRKVKIVFKHGVIKDLDQDILAKDPGPASAVIKGLRQRGVTHLDQLLKVLGPRHTSWPRDVAIIAGQLVGVTVRPGASQQDIYQDVLRTIGKISHDHLFHDSITMLRGFTWCPTNLFNIRQSPARYGGPTLDLKVERNGDLTGEWHVVPVTDKLRDRYIWKNPHPLVEGKIKDALIKPSDYRLLVCPRDDRNSVVRALLVEPLDEENSNEVFFIGAVYFHPPLTRRTLQLPENGNGVNVKIVGDTGARHARALTALMQGSSMRINGGTFMVSEFLSAAAEGDLNRLTMQSNVDKKYLNVTDDAGNSALQLAAQKGHSDIVQQLLYWGADPRNANEDQKEALHLAAQGGHHDIVRQLLEKKVELNSPDKTGWTALHYASWDCSAVVAKALLDHGADPNVKDSQGQTPLHLAAERGSGKIVASLLTAGADAGALCLHHQSAIHRAAWGGSADVIGQFVKLCKSFTSAQLDAPDGDKRTALHIAAMNGYSSVVHLLLHLSYVRKPENQEFAALHEVGGHGMWALRRATEPVQRNEVFRPVARGRPNTWAPNDRSWTTRNQSDENVHITGLAYDLDTDRDLELEDRNGFTPLLLAAYGGHTEVVGLLLSAGAKRISLNSALGTPFSSAVKKGHRGVVEALLHAECGIINAADFISRNPTALSVAAENGHAAVVSLLHRAGWSLETKDESSRTPLLLASANGNSDLVEFLLLAGAEKEVRGVDQQTPLITAVRNGHREVVRLLLNADVELEAKDTRRRTALSWAAEAANEELAKMLIQKGAIITSSDMGKESPLHLALYKYLLSGEGIIRLLLEYGTSLKPEDASLLLHKAIGNGHKMLVKLILDRDSVLLEESSLDGKSPLCAAVLAEDLALVKLLLQRGANPNFKVKSRNDQTPLELAFAVNSKNKPQLITLLLGNGAELECSDEGGRLLIWAITNGEDALAKLALDKGANPEFTDDSRITPLAAATKRGCKDVMELLVEKMKRTSRGA